MPTLSESTGNPPIQSAIVLGEGVPVREYAGHTRLSALGRIPLSSAEAPPPIGAGVSPKKQNIGYRIRFARRGFPPGIHWGQVARVPVRGFAWIRS